jgi:hypothetical protein
MIELVADLVVLADFAAQGNVHAQLVGPAFFAEESAFFEDGPAFFDTLP